MQSLYRYPAAARRYLLAVWWLLVAFAGRAQNPGWSGAYLSGLNPASGSSYTNAVATDAQGNVFVVGQFTGTVEFGSISLTTAGGDDTFVAKFVPTTGTWAWAQRGGGTSADAGLAIAVSGNSVYVTGLIYNNLGNVNNVSFGGTNAANSFTAVAGASTALANSLFVAKYFDAGSTALLGWVQVGGAGGAAGFALAARSDQVYVLATAYNDLANSRSVVFGGQGTTPGTVPVRGASSTASDDWVLARYTDNGGSATLDWTQVAGGTGGDIGYGIAVSGSSIYATGFFTNDNRNTNAVVLGGSGTGPAGTSPQAGASSTADGDLVLVKYIDNGSSGSYAWSQVGGGTGSDTGRGVAVSGSSVYVTGDAANNLSNTQAVVFGGSGLGAGTSPVSGASPVVSSDLLLTKYQDNGATGSYGWSQVGGGTRADGGTAVAVSGNRVYVAGQLINSAANATMAVFGGSGSMPGLGTAIGPDLLLTCYLDNGATGAYAWGLPGGGNGADSGNGLALSGQQVYAIGYTAPSATFGPTTLAAPRPGIFGVLARLTDPALTPLAVRAGSAGPGLTLYPNPTRAAAVLAGAAPGTVVQVLDVLGRVVAATAADATGAATLPPLPAGLYLVRAGAAARRLSVE